MRALFVGLVGTVSIVAAVAIAVVGGQAEPGNPLVITAVATLAILACIAGLAKVSGARGGADAVATAPWSTSGALADEAPERSPAEHDLSGERLASVVESAGDTARDDGTVVAGLEAVRPALRAALIAVYVQGGWTRQTAREWLADGSWTDDTVAAAVLDERVRHPGRSLLERFEAWLFPERVVRREVREAVQAIATTADAELPTVAGQHAPRSVPVLQPTLEDLRRGADGHLQRAVDPLGARGGSPVETGGDVGDVTAVDESLRLDAEPAFDDHEPPAVPSTDPPGDDQVSGDEEVVQ